MPATTLLTALTAERTGTQAMTNIAPPAPANSLQDRFDRVGGTCYDVYNKEKSND